MKNILFIFLVSVALIACSGTKGDSLEAIQQRAGITAQEYYRLLLQEKYEDFVAGMDGADSLPADYHEQMVANAVLFVKQQKDDHKGMKDVTYSHCVADTAAHTADAMLVIEYADDIQETVCVPLVERNGIWYMK